MKLHRLSVDRFQCIEGAELELGPGLNVLYGPNDLGKSSLAWAIRAVLLLQHNSTAHERFVSWHGGGEPSVSLTLSDDSGRYWRVRKVFGTSSNARSTLESSKNGQTYTSEESGRKVDDKLRELLHWGVQRPGGRGARHGFPASFLTQVLLAEQTDVRSILFEGSLVHDEEESGRARLTRALGALAQDPRFKAVLDEAQAHVDRAFTPTGKRRSGAGSPFRALAEKIEGYQQQRDAIASKVREAECTELRIRELIEQRGQLAARCEEASARRDAAISLLASKERRTELLAHRDRNRAMLASIDAVRRELAAKQSEVERLQQELAGSSSSIEQAREAAEQADARRAVARSTFDELSMQNATRDPRTAELESKLATARESEQRSQRAWEQTQTAYEQVSTLAQSIQKTAGAHREARERSRRSEYDATAAAEKESRLREAHELARQRLQEVLRGEQAQARELARKDLEKRTLQLASHRTEAAAALERALAVQRAEDQAQALQRKAREHRESVASMRDLVGAGEAALAALDSELAMLGRLATFGRLGEARDLLAAARALSDEVERELARAATLSAEAATIRARMRPGLPTPDELERMRGLDEEIKVAEARVTAIAVSIRPLRPFMLRVARDGAFEPSRLITEPTSISAREIMVEIEDVAEIEVAGGDPDARSRLATLRERWSRECVPILDRSGCANVASLVHARREGDQLLSKAESLEQDARRIEDVESRRRPSNIDELARRCAQIELELGSSNLDEVASRFARLGAGWSTALKVQTSSKQREREQQSGQLELQRTQLTRTDALLEGLEQDAAAKARELGELAAVLGEPWGAVADRSRAEIERAEGEAAGIERQLAMLAQAGSSDEATAHEAEAAARAALELAQRGRETLAARAQGDHDACIAAQIQLEADRARARELDSHRVWRMALLDDIPELSTARWRTELDAAHVEREACKRLLIAAQDELQEHARRRERGLEKARQDAHEAEQRATAARLQHEHIREQDQLQRGRLAALQIETSELRLQEAKVDVAETELEVGRLQLQLDALGDVSAIEPADVAAATSDVDRLAKQLRDTEDELKKSQGALEQVAGAKVRDELSKLEQAIAHHRDEHRDLELELDAWKLLVEVLRQAESTESQHLGRQLAGPVSRRFQELTKGRYGSLELGTHLETMGLHAVGELREISALSVGTQDQLATLLRLCIAEQLSSTIVLDDHLSQSDPARTAWFNDALRSAAQQLQIIFLTCRPSETLLVGEQPLQGEVFRDSASGRTRAIDLTRVIRRYALTS